MLQSTGRQSSATRKEVIIMLRQSKIPEHVLFDELIQLHDLVNSSHKVR
jgi:hypothetical protein